MADLERGKRIKALREGTIERQKPVPAPRYLKQRHVIEGVEAMLGGKFFVTIRGYQDWERTGGIKYENAELLADFYGVDVTWLFYGPNGKTVETPDLAAMLNGGQPNSEVDVEVLERLERMEGKLDLLVQALRLIPTEDGVTLEEAVADLERDRPARPRAVEDAAQGPTDTA